LGRFSGDAQTAGSRGHERETLDRVDVLVAVKRLTTAGTLRDELRYRPGCAPAFRGRSSPPEQMYVWWRRECTKHDLDAMIWRVLIPPLLGDSSRMGAGFRNRDALISRIPESTPP
jgi:hypothetical protein